jgi:hypothetical protein
MHLLFHHRSLCAALWLRAGGGAFSYAPPVWPSGFRSELLVDEGSMFQRKSAWLNLQISTEDFTMQALRLTSLALGGLLAAAMATSAAAFPAVDATSPVIGPSPKPATEMTQYYRYHYRGHPYYHRYYWNNHWYGHRYWRYNRWYYY